MMGDGPKVEIRRKRQELSVVATLLLNMFLKKSRTGNDLPH